MSPHEPILLICHGFPPVHGIGGRRWAKFAKELARRGHPVHVIHGKQARGAPVSLWNEDGATPGIVHHPLPRRYPAARTKQPVNSFQDKVMYHLWGRILPLMTRGNWYDKAIFWRKQLLREAGTLITRHHIRNVIVTGAPFSLLSHSVGLKKRFPHINLVADFRDRWTWGPYYGQSMLGPKRMARERAKEAAVARLFDKVISPAATIVEHLQGLYGGPADRYVTVPHAIDLDDLVTPVVRPQDGIFRMIYAGSLYGAEEAEAYFDQLLRAFEALREERPAAFAITRLDLFITGHDTKAFEQKVNMTGLSGHIRFHSPIPPKEILARIAGSNLILNFFPSYKKDILGTKFNEIFYLRRPVLHVGDPGLVSRTIVERKLGASLRVDELVTELPRIISGERVIEVDQQADHSAYLLGPITDRLIREVLV